LTIDAKLKKRGWGGQEKRGKKKSSKGNEACRVRVRRTGEGAGSPQIAQNLQEKGKKKKSSKSTTEKRKARSRFFRKFGSGGIKKT